jgi:organic radical activating enzyme
MTDKSCYKKTQQMSFWLNRDQAAACCRAYPVEFHNNLPQLIESWHQEDKLMKQGHLVPSCEHCWADERQGIQSYRQQSENDSFKHLEIIDIDFSNLCNHMCVYCSPKYSSMWEQSIQKHGMFPMISSTNRNNLAVNQPSEFFDQNFDSVLQYISTKKDQSILLGFLGGEPLMQQRNIEKILDIGSKKIAKLTISTNLNPPSNRIMKLMLDKLGRQDVLHLSISMDASPEFNHVSRAGFDQTRFLDNLDYVKQQNVSISFTGVYNSISVFDLNNLVKWHNANNHSYVIKPLNNPDCLKVRYLPLTYRQQIWNSLEDTSDLPDFVEQSLHVDDAPEFHQRQQYHYMNEYFLRSGIDPESVPNPLFVEWWTETKKLFASNTSIDT